MTSWWRRIKKWLVSDDVILLPASAGYCPKSLSHRHCVAKDKSLWETDLCILCGEMGVGLKSG